MKTLLCLLRLTVFIVIAPIVAIIMLFIFITPHNVDWWFSSQRRQEAVDVWRKLWTWVRATEPTER